MAVKAKPDGYHVVTPYLVVDGAARSIDFLKEVFDAQEVERLAAPGDRIGHAEIRIGDSLVMLGDSHGEHKPLRMMLYVYVDDAPGCAGRRCYFGAGAGRSVLWRPQRRGEGRVLRWIATHIEDVPPAEPKRRAQAAMQRADGN